MRMITLLFTLCFSALGYSQVNGAEVQPDNLSPKVEMKTNHGTLVIELDRTNAKATVDNWQGMSPTAVTTTPCSTASSRVCGARRRF